MAQHEGFAMAQFCNFGFVLPLFEFARLSFEMWIQMSIRAWMNSQWLADQMLSSAHKEEVWWQCELKSCKNFLLGFEVDVSVFCKSGFCSDASVQCSKFSCCDVVNVLCAINFWWWVPAMCSCVCWVKLLIHMSGSALQDPQPKDRMQPDKSFWKDTPADLVPHNSLTVVADLLSSFPNFRPSFCRVFLCQVLLSRCAPCLKFQRPDHSRLQALQPCKPISLMQLIGKQRQLAPLSCCHQSQALRQTGNSPSWLQKSHGSLCKCSEFLMPLF